MQNLAKIIVFIKRRWTFFVLVLVLLPVIFPILHPGTLVTGDGMGHLFRQISYHRAIADGQIPPRWASLSLHGLGAPIFLFSWFLPYLMIEVLLQLGLPIVASVKLFSLFCILIGPVGMYLWSKKLAGPLPALAAAALYAWAPYRLMGVFLYGDWGNMLAMTLVPFLGLAADNLAEKPNRKNWVVAVFLVAALITAHNLSVFIYLPLIFVFTVVRWTSWQAVANLMLAYLGGVGLTAFFWLPAVTLNRLVQFDWAGYFWSASFEHFPTLLASIGKAWNQYFSPLEKVWYYDFSLGLPYLTVLALSPILLLVSKKGVRGVLGLSLLFGAGAYFLTLHASLPVWVNTPLKMFLVSYRFYSPATAFLSVAVALFLSRFSKHLLASLVILVIPVAAQAGRLYLTPATGYADINQEYLSRPQPSQYAPGTTIVMGAMEFLPIWASPKFAKELDLSRNEPQKLLPDENIQKINSRENRTNLLSFDYTAKAPGSVTISTFFFPNWKAEAGGKLLSVQPDEVGRVRLSLPKTVTSQTVKLTWQTSGVEWLGMAISAISLAGVIIVYSGSLINRPLNEQGRNR